MLTGKTILITRAAHQADGFVRSIEERGAIAVVFPTIEITPPDSWEACDKAIASLYMYDGLIFTSANGVEFFFHRLLESQSKPIDLKSKMIFVVGEKTKQTVEQHGLTVTTMPERFTAFDLAKKLEQEDLNGKSFLFPRGMLGKDMLADNLKILGANVDSVIVYQTKKPKNDDVAKLKSLLFNAKIDVATFTSPSTFKNFVELLSPEESNKLQNQVKIAVIGPVTAEAVAHAGFTPTIIAHESTIESLISAISDYYRSEIKNQKSEISQ